MSASTGIFRPESNSHSSVQFHSVPVHEALRGSTTSANAFPDSSTHVMGMLKSSKSGRVTGTGLWKKQFWVVNFALNRLEYYKNDQAINPKGVIEARQIVAVSTAADKQNKFFYLSLKLREKKTREFRMISASERDRWHTAVLKLMQTIKSTDRLQSLVSVVQQRMDKTSKELGIEVKTNISELGVLPDELMPFCLEGVEIGIELARKIVTTKGQGASSVHSIVVAVRKEAEKGATAGTRYDPLMKKLTLVVSLLLDSAEQVEFRHIDVNAALNLLSSSVWRDPSLEGWTTLDRAAKGERERIASLLHIEDFKVSLQWSSDVNLSNAEITAYLARHVNAQLLADVYSMLLEICRHEDSLMTKDRTSIRPLNVNGNDAEAKKKEAATPQEAWKIPPADCLRQYVTGLGILLDSDAIKQDEQPELMLTHTMWDHPHLFSGFALTSLYRQKHGMPDIENELDHLREQLNEVVLQVRVATACQCIEHELSELFGVRDGVSVNWDTLMQTLQSTRCDNFPIVRLPQIVHACCVPYINRVQRVMNFLNSPDGFGEVFHRCVAAVRINFKSITDTAKHPTVFRGVFSESVVLAHSETDPSHLMMVSEGDPIPVRSHDVDVLAVFPVAYLSSWFTGFFSQPGNCATAPTKQGAEDDESDDEYDLDEIGENVAAERTVETMIFSDKDVVIAVYNSQGTHLEYMANASIIGLGVNCISAAFPDVTISMHDMAKLLIHSLARLRTLAMTLESPLLTLDEARGVLKTFCEYPESEARIDHCLTQHEGATSVAGGMNFQTVAKIMLTELLPTDVVLAMRSRRNVLILGLDNTGKSMIQNVLRSIVRPTYPSVGVTETIVAYREWALNFKELGGRAEIRKNWKQFLQLLGHIHSVVFVVDASLPSAFPDAKKYLRDTLSCALFKGLPVLLLLNNYHSTPDAAIVLEELDFESITKKNNQPHFSSTCDVTILQQRATVDPGLATGLDWLCNSLREKCQDPEHCPALPKDCLAAAPELPASQK